MFVKLWMTTNVLTVNSTETLVKVEQLMREHRIRRVPVVDDHGHAVGIISRKDLFRAMPSIFDPHNNQKALEQAGTIPASQIMTPDPISVEPSTPLEEAALLMRTHKFGSLVVVHQGELAGIITETNIFDAFLEGLGAKKTGARFELCLDKEPAAFYALMQVFKKYEMRILGMTVLPDFSDQEQLVTVKVQGEQIEHVAQKLWEVGLRFHRLHREEKKQAEQYASEAPR